METEGRGMYDLTMYIMCLGVVLVVLGPLAGFYSFAVGLMALGTCSVLAIGLIALRGLYFRSQYY
jgi:hypothetical protein